MPKASHHIYVEQPEYVSQRLARLVADPSSHVSINLSRVRSGKSSYTWTHDSSNQENILEPPCPFVKGFDLEELNAFRVDYRSYRIGSPWGSRGEVGALVDPGSPEKHGITYL